VGWIINAFAARVGLSLVAACAPLSVAHAACSEWDLSGNGLSLFQSNADGLSIGVGFDLKQSDHELRGNARWLEVRDRTLSVKFYNHFGSVDGIVTGDRVDFTIYWSDATIGAYSGTINPRGRITGLTFDKTNPSSQANWYSTDTVPCRASPTQAAPQAPPLPARPVIGLGKVRPQPDPIQAGTTRPAPSSICESASNARARNSPAAPGLEAQCNAFVTRQAAGAPLAAELAARGEGIANGDPLSAALRDGQPEGPARRGFDIGIAAAEGQTAPGPGKDRIRASLTPAEAAGFDLAVGFSLDRNRNAALAATGAAIADADPVVAEARAFDPDARYRLGFDIATAIFGDPALGAKGNTATGPGSLGIRDALNAVSQRGFNDAVNLHLGRTY